MSSPWRPGIEVAPGGYGTEGLVRCGQGEPAGAAGPAVSGQWKENWTKEVSVMGNGKGRDGPAKRKGGRGRIGAQTSTPSDHLPRERDLAFSDDSGSLACQQTGEDPVGSPVTQDGRETEPGFADAPEGCGASSSGAWKEETTASPAFGSPTDCAPVVWESDWEQDGRFRVKVRVLGQPGGDKRTKCVEWLAFGGFPPSLEVGEEPGD